MSQTAQALREALQDMQITHCALRRAAVQQGRWRELADQLERGIDRAERALRLKQEVVS
tara:strand:+ start:3484 stop:3660 length:177 start_codon:yes stop_codon:yes gene_type:complete